MRPELLIKLMEPAAAAGACLWSEPSHKVNCLIQQAGLSQHDNFAASDGLTHLHPRVLAVLYVQAAGISFALTNMMCVAFDIRPWLLVLIFATLRKVLETYLSCNIVMLRQGYVSCSNHRSYEFYDCCA